MGPGLAYTAASRTLVFDFLVEGTPATYWIAELKCCRDSDPRQQLDKAHGQTEHIAKALQEADPTAEIHEVPLLVGVAGSVFNYH